MNKRFLKDTLAWGFVLWVIGYALGMMLFAVVPASLIGWFIAPICAAITLWVAFKKIQGDTLLYYCLVGIAWLSIAVLGDYLFIVKAFNPADGYYKPDVYLYYALTVAIPFAAGWRKALPHAPVS